MSGTTWLDDSEQIAVHSEHPHFHVGPEPTALRRSAVSRGRFDKHDRYVAWQATTRRRSDKVVALLNNFMINASPLDVPHVC